MKEIEATHALTVVDHKINERRSKIRLLDREFSDACDDIRAREWSSKREVNMEIQRRLRAMQKEVDVLEQEMTDLQPERDAALKVVHEAYERENS